MADAFVSRLIADTFSILGPDEAPDMDDLVYVRTNDVAALNGRLYIKQWLNGV